MERKVGLLTGKKDTAHTGTIVYTRATSGHPPGSTGRVLARTSSPCGEVVAPLASAAALAPEVNRLAPQEKVVVSSSAEI